MQQANNIAEFNFKSFSTQVLRCFVLNLYEMISSSPKVQTTENSSSFDCTESHGLTTKDFFFTFWITSLKLVDYLHHLSTTLHISVFTQGSI
jgi:hypothetical protein